MQNDITGQAGPSRQTIVSAIAWATIQSWGGRVFSFVLLVLLARLLHPADFGVFAIAVLIQFLISQVAELGFGEALVQRRDLTPTDVNLPFFVSMALSTALSITVALFADSVATLAGVPAAAEVVRALACTAPFVTASAFQEALYRRDMKFRPLAVRMLVGIVLGGLAAIGAALAGWGVWSLFVQSAVGTLVSLVWLWTRPVWVPSLVLGVASFWQLVRFSANVFLVRLLDFGSARGIEVVLAHSLGAAALGLYSAAQRLNGTLLQLLQSAFVDVALSTLSRVQHDRELVRSTYMKSLSLSLLLAAPAFVLAAAVAPELVHVLLGPKWSGVEDVLVPLFGLGAVQSVQLMNGPYLTSSGHPRVIVWMNLIKLPVIFAGLALTFGSSMSTVVIGYVASQLVISPISFWLTAATIGAGVWRVLRRVGASYLVLALCFAVTVLMRRLLEQSGISLPDVPLALLVAGVFLSIYALLVSTFMRPAVADGASLLTGSRRIRITPIRS